MPKLIRFCVAVLFVGLLANVAAPDSSAQGKKKGPDPEPKKEESKQPLKGKHFPEIPSLPLLNQQEQFAIAQLIQLVVLDDIGKGPKGPRAVSGKESRQAFSKLGPESMPLMIPFMNVSTQQGWTCPISMLGTKLAHFVEKAGARFDLDFLEYMYANLGKGLTLKNPSDQFTGLKNLTNGQIIHVKRELGHKYKVMEFDALIERVAEFEKQPSTKHAEWRLMVMTMAVRKDKLKCFDAFLSSLEKAKTPTERKTLHVALVECTGVDHGPTSFESPGAVPGAVEQWKKWRQENK